MKDSTIYLGNKVSSFSFYNEFLEDVYKHYENKGREIPPIISLEFTEFIDASVLPNLIGFGLMLKHYHNEPTKLLLNYNPNLIYFLYKSRFFQITGKYNGLNIYDFDEKYIGGFDLMLNRQHLDEHIIHRYKPTLNYYDIENEDEQLDFRKQLIHVLRDDHLLTDYLPVLQFLDRIENYELDYFLDILSEIISNSILYSLSESFTIVFANKFKTIISLSDVGIGFKDALKRKKNYKTNFRNDLIKEIKFNDELGDFVVLFEILNYSQNTNRFNLWRLKETVVSKGGAFRIHYNSTQLVFSTKCSRCHKSENLLNCAKCFLRSYTAEQKVSSLRIFDYVYQGVHIEIELKNPIDNPDYV